MNGERIRRVAGVTRRDAQKMLAEIVAEAKPVPLIRRGADRGEPVLLRTILEADLRRQQVRCRPWTYKTVRSLHSIILGYFGRKFDARRLTAKHIDDFIVFLSRERAAPTVNKFLTILKVALRNAVEDGLLEEMPCRIKNVRAPRRLPAILEPEEVRALAAVADPRVVPVIYTAAYTGMRRGELMALQWQDVDFAARTISIRVRGDFEPKTGEERIIPMNDALVEVLREHRKALIHAEDEDWVFQCNARRGSPWRGNQLTIWVSRAFREAGLHEGRKTGLHTLRRTFASTLLARGVDIRTVCELGGWSSPLVLLRAYAGTTDRRRRDAVERLGRLV